MSKKRAFVRYSKQGKIVPGSLILTGGSHPNGPSTWREVPADLCCDKTSCSPTNYGNWKLVTGGEAGDGVVLNDDSGNTNRFTFIGPNDDDGDGWVYLTRYFPTTTCLVINYNWTSFDDNSGGPPNVDWPVYWTSSTEPTGIPEDLTVRVEDTPADGTWNITVPAGQWFGVGIYSDDSCCGRGFLGIHIAGESPCTLFSDTIYWGEDSGVCSGGVPITVTGDGTTFCNSNNFTGPAIAGIGTGSAFFRFGSQFKTVNVISGNTTATFNGGCDPCP